MKKGQEGDRQSPDHSGHDARQDLDSRARQTRDPTRTCLVDRLLEPLDYLIVALEKTERAPTRCQVGDDCRQSIDELAYLIDERWDEEEAEPDHREEGRQEDDPRRQRPGPTPRRSKYSTAGLSAAARKAAMRTHVMTLKAK